MADPHSPHICEVCNCEYQPRRNKDGTPYKTKHHTCSRSCYNKLRDRNRSVRRFCASCLQFYGAVPRARQYGRRFCSHACYTTHHRFIAAEIEGLRRIGRARRKTLSREWRARVQPEIDALKRIASRVNLPSKVIICDRCGKKARRARRWFRYCSLECRREQAVETERRVRRVAKAKRRALMRSVDADAIDPLQVFERDKWRCHLCGITTLPSLRGTSADRAPELEHIVSLADGGTHTWGNVACSCRKCNHEKGAASRGQLRLEIG
ncbi:HNH endonuclease [Halomonas litopenaei]|uniref:HNH endonuclease n=1 Tax=Halomonas litopenaei TaxID=2109328 RepID=UPI003D6D14D6